MLVDGKKIRDEILEELKGKFEDSPAVLAVVRAGDDEATETFVRQKEKMAGRIGVDLQVFHYEAGISQDELESAVNRLALDRGIDGIIVQLPLPPQIDAGRVTELIPPEKDIDALGSETRVMSPVAAAVREILERCQVSLEGNSFLVIGQGKLVGRPVALWLASEGAEVEAADLHTKDLQALAQRADVIISGAGKAGLVKPEMVKEGVVIIDAGTSEQAGQLAGDADPACAEKAKIFTPVPGGVGPVVLAMLFKNLWKLSRGMKA